MKLYSLLLAAGAASAAVLPRSQEPCPYHRPDGADLVDDEYVVMLNKGHTLEQHFKNIGIDLSQDATLFYPIQSINGYRARLNEHTLHQMVRYDPGVSMVEHDHYLQHGQDLALNDGSEPGLSELSAQADDEDDSFTGRIYRRLGFGFYSDSRAGKWWQQMVTAGNKQSLDPNGNYRYNLLEGAGKNVDIYVLDSGIRLSHADFQGRARNFNGATTSPYCNTTTMDDTDGHGTHVAALAGGRSSLAPWSNIINVKIACGGSRSPEKCIGQNGGLAQAISDITSAHAEKQNRKSKVWRGSVINLSAGQQNTPSLRNAVEAAKAQGIPMAVAAGNGNTRNPMAPCIYSDAVMCVGACKPDYSKMDESNYGKYVSIIGPGEGITSAFIGSDRDYYRLWGTSQATPFVAGFMATIVGYEGINNNVATVYSRVASNQLTGKLTGFSSDTPNNLINSGFNAFSRPLSKPYNGIPHDKELKLAVAEVEDAVTSASVASITTPPSSASASETIIACTNCTAGADYITVGSEVANSTYYAVVTESWTAAESLITTGWSSTGDYEDIFTLTPNATELAQASSTMSISTTSNPNGGAPPPPPSTTSSAPPAVVTSGCTECGNNLGSSSCSASDNQCLVNQCKTDPSCQKCTTTDCNQYA